MVLGAMDRYFDVPFTIQSFCTDKRLKKLDIYIWHTSYFLIV